MNSNAVARTMLAARRAVVATRWLAVTIPLLAASPSPTSASGGDPRSSGQGPGLVGDPLFAFVVVLLIGVGALLATLAYIRMTSRHRN